MAEIRTVVTFQSPEFNTKEQKEYFINEGCFGDDLAHSMMDLLRACGVQTDKEAGQEDFGWYFGFRVGETDYQFVIGYRPGDGDDPAVWIGWLERKAGLVGSLFGARKRGIQAEAVKTIHSVVSALPRVGGIRWHRKEDFDAGNEELGQGDPAA